MNDKLSKIYDKGFYVELVEGSSESSPIVLELLYNCYKPKSVIDIGCGQGAWLAAAESLGTLALKGIDGSWVKQEALLSKNIDFSSENFEKAMPKLKEQYDLCICVEVAEHLSETKAGQFISFLCTASDIVLFSAAVKDQGGTNHLNEQWQSYWINLFKSNGYECIDFFRPYLWNNKSVEWWYRQNLFLFVRPQTNLLDFKALKQLEKPIYDIVHPMNYEDKIKG